MESVNPAAERLFGYPCAELINRNIDMLLPTLNHRVQPRQPENHGSCALASMIGGLCEVSVRSKGGNVFPVELSLGEVWIAGTRKFIGVARDITCRKEAQQLLLREKELAEITLDSIADAVVTTDLTGHLSYLNPVAQRLTGWGMDEARGLCIDQLFSLVPVALARENQISCASLDSGVISAIGNAVLLARDGTEYVIEESAAPILTRDGVCAGGVLVFRNLTTANGAANQPSHQASHDGLTGLLNQHEFEILVHRLLESSKTTRKEHALLCLDVDQFTVVNQVHGHAAGDELLRQLATLLGKQLRGSDILACLGGDEFGVLLQGCSLAGAQKLATAIVDAVADFSFVWNDQRLSMGVSIGLVPINEHSDGLRILMEAVKSACYSAKEKGSGQVQTIHPGADEPTRYPGEMGWLSRIRQAFAENRFFLEFQKIEPIGSVVSLYGDHCEVLIRMRDEAGNRLAPSAFLPAAQRHNMMPTLDRWVVRTVIEQLVAKGASQPVRGKRRSQYAINLSEATLGDDDFKDFLMDQFQRSQVQPEMICFEVAENVAIGNLTQTIEFARFLKSIGCRFALDDFGCGLGAFAHLKNLEIDYLKIDGSLIRAITTDPVSFSTVDAINRIGHVMGVTSIAECVENKQTLDKLKEIGIDYAQGFFNHEPQYFGEYLFACNVA